MLEYLPLASFFKLAQCFQVRAGAYPGVGRKIIAELG
jgi:hypothetical protein